MAQYAIINVETIQKRIDELEKANEDFKLHARTHNPTMAACEATLSTLKQILSQSTPLLPEVSKAYDAGMLHKELSQMFDYPKGRYLSNLKLDI